ncbi:uncharacterized protein TNCV_2741501 [Trichonephila clavipes]|nr:uncharacterized protein TNCV_2741501 [Trichonephila clavipes]
MVKAKCSKSYKIWSQFPLFEEIIERHTRPESGYDRGRYVVEIRRVTYQSLRAGNGKCTLLSIDLVILKYYQVMMTTPELACPIKLPHHSNSMALSIDKCYVYHTLFTAELQWLLPTPGVHFQFQPSHVKIDGDEKVEFLARTSAEEEVSPPGCHTLSELSSLKKIDLINLEELFLVIFGTSEEIQEVHSGLCLGNIRLPSRALYEVIARCGESKSQEIRRLLAEEQLGDRKPSELFRVMQRRSESPNVTDSLLLELFLQQLSPNVQSILASIQPLTAQKASEVADRILEVTPVQVSAVSNYFSANSDDSSESKLLKELKLLRQEVKELRRSRSFSRNRIAIAERVLCQ